jgi:hypothetical protein
LLPHGSIVLIVARIWVKKQVYVIFYDIFMYMRVCIAKGCERKHAAKGYCDMHYHRVKAHGDPNANFKKIKIIKKCKVQNCIKIGNSAGFCQMHYRRNRLYGDPNVKMNVYRDYASCSVKGCTRKHNSKGYCKIHYQSILKPEIARQAKRRRRAKRLNNGFEFYTEKEVLDTYGTNCYLCKKPIDMNAPRTTWTEGWQYGLHIEHVFDIALGGPDTLKNVRPSHGICNLKKKPKEMV